MGLFKCEKCSKYGLILNNICDICCNILIQERHKKENDYMNEKIQENIEKLNNNPHKINKIIALLMIQYNIEITNDIID